MHKKVMVLLILLNSYLISQDKLAENVCSNLANKHIQNFKLNDDSSIFNIEYFYSKKEDTCIFIKKKVIGNEIIIRDLSKSIIIDGHKNYNILLDCNNEGVNSIIIDKVRKYKGKVFTINYKLYVDNGFGGLPKTLKSPNKVYTKDDCNLILEKWRKRLK